MYHNDFVLDIILFPFMFFYKCISEIYKQYQRTHSMYATDYVRMTPPNLDS